MGNLKKKALLPVVVFTLSKKRCEENAATLTNLDLCTSTEKSEVHVAIEKALGRLKGMSGCGVALLYALAFIRLNGATTIYQPPIRIIGGRAYTNWVADSQSRPRQAATTDQTYEGSVIEGDWGTSRRFASDCQRGSQYRRQFNLRRRPLGNRGWY